MCAYYRCCFSVLDTLRDDSTLFKISLLDSSFNLGVGCRQKGHDGSVHVTHWRNHCLCRSLYSIIHYTSIVDLLKSIDGDKKQIGQSLRWLLSGCRNNISSFNSAAHFLHVFLLRPVIFLIYNTAIERVCKRCISWVLCHRIPLCLRKHNTLYPRSIRTHRNTLLIVIPTTEGSK